MILTNGFEDIEAIGTFAILRRAGLEVDIYSLNGTDAHGRYGTHIVDLYKIEDISLINYDCLLISGGPQYIELEKNEKFLNIIQEFMSRNKIIAAICAGPTILGHLGLLKNINYTCFTNMNEDFGGTYNDVYCVKDKNIITARSAAATIDFAFLIIETLLGKKVEEKIKKEIYY